LNSSYELQQSSRQCICTAGTLEKACTRNNIPYYTLETPTRWPLQRRVDTLKLLVDEVLKDF